MGYTPWYLERYPEFSLRSAAGETVGDCDGGFMEFSFLHPRRLATTPPFLKKWKCSLQTLVRRCRSYPALGGWMLSSRPRLGAGPDPVRNLKSPGLLGHNAHYIEAFRAWLKERYGTEAALRAAWDDRRVTFARARPPGAEQIRTAETVPTRRYRAAPGRVHDWIMFRAVALAEGQSWQQEVIREEAPGALAAPLLAGFTATGPLDPDGLAADVMGESGGIGPMALSLAANAAPLPLLTHVQDVALAVAAAAERPVWVTDYAFRRMGLLGRGDRENLIPAPYMPQYAWGAVLGGGRGFFFRHWDSAPGPSSLAYPGAADCGAVTLSDEGIEVAKLARVMKTIGPWLGGAVRERPRYGILVSWRAVLFDDPAGHHPLAAFNALALAGIHEARLVTDGQLRRGGAAPCEVLFAPYVTCLGKEEVRRLRDFVAGGGVLISDTYLGSVGRDGAPRRPLSDGLEELFGVSLAVSGTSWTDAGAIGAMTTEDFRRCPVSLPISLSWYAGGYRVRAEKGTRVLARYSGGEPGKGAPAITVAKRGLGRAVLLPRVRLWPDHLRSRRAPQAPLAELRALKMGRSRPDFNGALFAIVLRRLLAEVDALPEVRLVRAPVSERHLAEQAELAASAGFTPGEIHHSAEIVRASQVGIPFVGRGELEFLEKKAGWDPASGAPVRVGLLAGAEGGRAVVVINGSSWSRDATVRIPSASLAVDLLTGDEFRITGEVTEVALAPYQARLLALFDKGRK